MQGRFWTLTYNNYDDETIESWRKVVDEGKASYLCFQQEKAPTTGTPHLQGYAVFEKKKRLAAVRKVLGKGVFGILSNGSPSSNREYCRKEESSIAGTFEEYGKLPPPPEKGKRADLEAFRAAVKEGIVKSRKQARELFPDVSAKYPRFVYDYIDDQKTIKVKDFEELRDWQKELQKTLEEEPDNRKIIFVVDQDGGAGKTTFAKWYCRKHEDAQYLEASTKADMAYALQDDLRVLFVNVTRSVDKSAHDYLYSFLEAVKDGMVFSRKYESRVKYFGDVHVVVLMNSEPNRELLTCDRYHVLELS